LMIAIVAILGCFAAAAAGLYDGVYMDCPHLRGTSPIHGMARGHTQKDDVVCIFPFVGCGG
jgi:hypothetical protein